MIEYKASIEYTPDNMRLLGAAIDNAFRFGMKISYGMICIVMILYACYTGLETPGSMLGVALGCLLLPSVNAFERQRTNAAIRRMKGKIVRMDYSFRDHSFLCATAEEKNEFRYDTLIRLMETRDFLYMFPNRDQAYMIDVSSIQPSGEKTFKAFITEKTGLQWTRKMSLLSLDIRALRFIRENTRKR